MSAGKKACPYLCSLQRGEHLLLKAGAAGGGAESPTLPRRSTKEEPIDRRWPSPRCAGSKSHAETLIPGCHRETRDLHPAAAAPLGFGSRCSTRTPPSPPAPWDLHISHSPRAHSPLLPGELVARGRERRQPRARGQR